ncbi:DUF1028 domain-containing protein [Bosea vaviloviae]|uniref:DUF1028 domain-containing protein n=1 Tax=Bosea vaviloviae TaxID=1526658 RepID=A0A0N1F5Z5_9HYPH|nr:DUF1028 domain-containing protein [Bosea vaviloviae]KPH81202.1 hypothetical protein AE618_09190 [Bosea vaviloviae]
MTFSLAGRCARTGMLGAIVTTSSIAVGSRCQHAAAGVGAALTQHMTDPRLGPLMLDLLKRGYTAQQAIDAAAAGTPRGDWRQLALIDREGRTASFSGANVQPELAEAHGRDCVALGNIVRSKEVPDAMVRAFEADPEAPLAARLIAALKAGDEAGGEFKPLVSTALVVVHEHAFPYVDLRVDSDPDPIATLARLWREYEPTADLYVTRATDPDTAIANRPKQS